MTQVEFAERLDRLEKGLAALQRRVLDVDVLLTSDDVDALTAADDDLATGRTTRLC